MKLLLGMPSPRNIPEVIDEWDKLKEDYIVAKHYKEWSAYQIIRNFFLNHKEYTHLGLCPDDLIVTQGDIDKLKRFDYPVICGVANVNLDEDNPVSVIIDSIPDMNREYRSFNFSKYEDLDDITQVQHAGFPLQIIRRDVVEQIDFDSESKLDGNDPDKWGNIDLIFSHNCKKLGIPIHCYKGAKMIHLRGMGELINNNESMQYVKWKHDNMYDFLSGSNWVKKTC